MNLAYSQNTKIFAQLPENAPSHRPHLENWGILISESEEGEKIQLQGNVFGHPNYPYVTEGEFITTSEILDVKGDLIKTRNNLYSLGKEHEDSNISLEELKKLIKNENSNKN